MNIVISSIYGRSGRDGISVYAGFIEKELSRVIPFDYRVYLTQEDISSSDEDTFILAAKATATFRTLTFAARMILGLNIPRGRILQKDNFFLLIGFHCVFLVPLLPSTSRIVYIPFDCWSARECKFARRERNIVGKLARTLWYRLVKLAENIAIPRLRLIGFISDAEIDSFKAEHPKLGSDAPKLAVIPSWRPAHADDIHSISTYRNASKMSVLIWMDCRISYGLESVRSVARMLSLLEPNIAASLEISALTRIGDSEFGDALRSFKIELVNIEFVDDIAARLATTDIVILPDLLGTGVKNRAIQTIMSGSILFATPHAAEGMSFLKKNDFFLLENLNDLQSAFRCVLANPKIATEMPARARSALLSEVNMHEGFIDATKAIANRK